MAVKLRKLSTRELAQTPGLAADHQADIAVARQEMRANGTPDLIDALAQPTDYSERIIPPEAGGVLGEVRRLQIDLIDSSPFNPRTTFEAEALAELGVSLQVDGLLQPIVVRPGLPEDGTEGRWTIVAGERRWRAAKLIGWTHITAMVRADVDDAAHVRIALLENLARTDLDPLEEARGYQMLQDLGMTQVAIADAIHRSQSAVAKSLQLLRAPAAVQAQLASGAIAPSHVLALMRFEAFPSVMVRVAQVAAEKRTPTKDLEKKGLGWEFTSALTTDKLARELGRAEFDTKVCAECPFGARHGGDYSFLCLKPEHFDELQKAARAVKKAAVKEAMETAAVDGKPVLRLNQLKFGQFVRIDWEGGAPEGCTKKCECRKAALDGSHSVQVCLKPQRFRDLKETQRKSKERGRALRAAGARTRLTATVDRVVVLTARDLAVLVFAVVEDSPALKSALRRHAPQLLPTKSGRLDLHPGQLAKLHVETLLRIGIEAALGDEIAVLDRYDSKLELTNWYLGAEPKEPPQDGQA